MLNRIIELVNKIIPFWVVLISFIIYCLIFIVIFYFASPNRNRIKIILKEKLIGVKLDQTYKLKPNQKRKFRIRFVPYMINVQTVVGKTILKVIRVLVAETKQHVLVMKSGRRKRICAFIISEQRDIKSVVCAYCTQIKNVPQVAKETDVIVRENRKSSANALLSCF